jgi:hypothetical protein
VSDQLGFICPIVLYGCFGRIPVDLLLMMRVEWRPHAALPGAKLKRVSVVRSYFDLHGVYFFSQLYTVSHQRIKKQPTLQSYMFISVLSLPKSLSNSGSRFNMFLLVIISTRAIVDFSYYLTCYIFSYYLTYYMLLSYLLHL